MKEPTMRKPPTPMQQQAQVSRWNALYKEGQSVSVRLDDGSDMITKTRSDAWLMGGHTAVIMVEGISGAHILERVSPI